MESITHLDPEPPEGGTFLPCTAATACPHQVRCIDPDLAALMLADHIWETHGGSRPKRNARKPRTTSRLVHAVSPMPDMELASMPLPDEVAYAVTSQQGGDLR